jgi:hypothetical protein
MTREPDLTLSREDLYELVWSKPMAELAKDVGLSDVALAKRCRKLGVPVPGRGYWARVAAGQEPRRPKLPKRESQYGDGSALTFGPPVEETPPTAAADLPPEEAAVRARIAAVTVAILPGLETASPPIQRLAHRHKVIPAKSIAWARHADRQGPVLEVHVDTDQTCRALLIADAVLRAADSLGWPFEAIKPKDAGYQRRPVEPPDPSPIGALVVVGEPFAIRIDEPQKRTDHVPTADEIRRQQKESWYRPPPWDFNWSGHLRLHAHEPDSRSVDHTWKDGKRRRLEDQVRDIVSGLYDLALNVKARRAEHERWERERREQERLEWARSRRRDIELKLIHELERQAGAWFRARFLQRYIRAARRALGEQHIEAKRGDKTVDFFDWAQDYVDQLDPLHPATRNDDLHDNPFTYHADADIQKGLARLTGFEGQQACKVAGGVDDWPVANTEDEDPDE